MSTLSLRQCISLCFTQTHLPQLLLVGKKTVIVYTVVVLVTINLHRAALRMMVLLREIIVLAVVRTLFKSFTESAINFSF